LKLEEKGWQHARAAFLFSKKNQTANLSNWTEHQKKYAHDLFYKKDYAV